MDEEGDRFTRTVESADPTADLAELVREVEADGYETWPPPRDALESWVSAWTEQAPTFDAEALRDLVLDSDQGLSTVADVLRLRRPLRVDGGAQETMLEHQLSEVRAVRPLLVANYGKSWPSLALGLRCSSPAARGWIDEVLSLHGDAQVVPALMTFVGQSDRVPSRSLAALALPAHLNAFIAPLRDTDFRVRIQAQLVLALRADLVDVERCLFQHVPPRATQSEMEVFLSAAVRSANPQHANRLSVWSIAGVEASLARRLGEAARTLARNPSKGARHSMTITTRSLNKVHGGPAHGEPRFRQGRMLQ